MMEGNNWREEKGAKFKGKRLSGVIEENHITQIARDMLLAVGLSLYFLSDLFKGLCFVSLANYFNIAVGKQSVTRFPVFPGSFFLVI